MYTVQLVVDDVMKRENDITVSIQPMHSRRLQLANKSKSQDFTLLFLAYGNSTWYQEGNPNTADTKGLVEHSSFIQRDNAKHIQDDRNKRFKSVSQQSRWTAHKKKAEKKEKRKKKKKKEKKRNKDKKKPQLGMQTRWPSKPSSHPASIS